jgi:hypothetical protein
MGVGNFLCERKAQARPWSCLTRRAPESLEDLCSVLYRYAKPVVYYTDSGAVYLKPDISACW